MKKKILRLLLSFSVVLTLMLAMAMTAMAATDEVEGIKAEQTVDTSSGNIEVTLEVTAEDGYSIEGVTLKNQKPDGYKLLSGKTEQSEEIIRSGNSKSLKTVFTKDTGAVKTGDSNSNSILLFGGIAILSAALIIFLLTRSKEIRNKIFTLFLCCVLVASSAFTFAGKSYAYESESTPIEFSKDVTIGSEKVTVKSVVSYDKIVANKYNVTPQVQGDHGTATVKVGDGEPTSETAQAVKGTSLVFTATPKDGYEFDHWEVVSGGIDIEASKTDNPINLTMPASNVTIMAVFEEIPTPATTYTVTFDLNGITGTEPEAQTITSGEKVTEPTDPTDTIHTFDGWYKTKDATGILSDKWDFDDGVTTDMTLYANWTKQMKDILGENFPNSNNNTAPDGAWERIGASEFKGFIAYKGQNTEQLLLKEESGGGVSCKTDNSFTRVDENTYVFKYVVMGNMCGVYTFNLEDGMLISIIYDGENTSYEHFSGTYEPAAPAPTTYTVTFEPDKEGDIEAGEVHDSNGQKVTEITVPSGTAFSTNDSTITIGGTAYTAVANNGWSFDSFNPDSGTITGATTIEVNFAEDRP